jgi:hypothetical protein
LIVHHTRRQAELKLKVFRSYQFSQCAGSRKTIRATSSEDL